MLNIVLIMGIVIATAAQIESVHTPIIGTPLMYKTVKLECLPNPKYIRNATCRLKAINWQKAVCNMECEIVKVIRNASLHLEVFQQNDVNKYQPFLINVTSNLCENIQKKKYSTYMSVIMNILADVSNVNHSCPYTGILFTRDLYLDQRFMPVYPPISMYKIVFRFLEGYPYEEIGRVLMYIQVLEKRRNG